MIKTKECYDCGKIFNIPEPEVFDGIVARPIDEEKKEYIEIWLCPQCREDAVEGGTICREDINILNDKENDWPKEVDP